MKQIVLGMLGCAIAIYTIVSCLSIYSISGRRNEVENSVSTVLKQNLEKYYVTQTKTLTEEGIIVEKHRQYSDSEVETFVKQDIISQLRSDSKVSVSVYACDMEQGILSVGVTEKFYMPNGMEKTIQCSKTIIVE